MNYFSLLVVLTRLVLLCYGSARLNFSWFVISQLRLDFRCQSTRPDLAGILELDVMHLARCIGVTRAANYLAAGSSVELHALGCMQFTRVACFWLHAVHLSCMLVTACKLWDILESTQRNGFFE